MKKFSRFNAFPLLPTRAVGDKNGIWCSNEILLEEMLVQVFSSIDFNTFFDPARLLLKWQNTRPYPTLLNLIKDDLVHLAVNFSSAAHSTMSRKENFNAFPNFFWPFHKLSQVHPNPIARNSHLYRHECKNIVLNPCHVWINHVNLYHSFHFFFLSVPWSQEGIN